MSRRNREQPMGLDELGRMYADQNDVHGEDYADDNVAQSREDARPQQTHRPSANKAYKLPSVRPVIPEQPTSYALPVVQRPVERAVPRTSHEDSYRIETMLDRAKPARVVVNLECADGAHAIEVYGRAYELKSHEDYDDERFEKAVDTAIQVRKHRERRAKDTLEVLGSSAWAIGEDNHRYEVFPLKSYGVPSEFEDYDGDFVQLSIDAMHEEDFCECFEIAGWKNKFMTVSSSAGYQPSRPASRVPATPVGQWSATSQHVSARGDGLDSYAQLGDQIHGAVNFLRSVHDSDGAYPSSRQRYDEQPHTVSRQPIDEDTPRSIKNKTSARGGAFARRAQRFSKNTDDSADRSREMSRGTSREQEPTTSRDTEQRPEENSASDKKRVAVLASFRDRLGATSGKQRGIAAVAVIAVLGGGFSLHELSNGGDKTPAKSTAAIQQKDAPLKSGQEYAWDKGSLCASGIAKVATKGTVALSVASHDYQGKQVWIDGGMQKLNLAKSSLSISECAPNTAVRISHDGDTEVATVDLSKLVMSSGPLADIQLNSDKFDTNNKIPALIKKRRKQLLKQYTDKADQAKIKKAKIPVSEVVGSDKKKTAGFFLSALESYDKTINSKSYTTEYSQLVTAAALARAQKDDANVLQQSALAPLKSWLESDAKKHGAKNVTVKTEGALPSLSKAYLDGAKKSIKDPLASSVQLDGKYHDGEVKAATGKIDANMAKQSYKITKNPAAKGGK